MRDNTSDLSRTPTEMVRSGLMRAKKVHPGICCAHAKGRATTGPYLLSSSSPRERRDGFCTRYLNFGVRVEGGQVLGGVFEAWGKCRASGKSLNTQPIFEAHYVYYSLEESPKGGEVKFIE